jgi:hypothetical protein
MRKDSPKPIAFRPDWVEFFGDRTTTIFSSNCITGLIRGKEKMVLFINLLQKSNMKPHFPDLNRKRHGKNYRSWVL